MGEIIRLNEEVKGEMGEMVRKPVEETLNAMPDMEADEITQAHKYERTEDRADTRAGHYHRKPVTKAGQMHLKVPKLWKRRNLRTGETEVWRKGTERRI